MKLLLSLPFIALLSTGQAFAAPIVVIEQGMFVEHGGGCRKDSPAGQCCHAGSQPYHCH